MLVQLGHPIVSQKELTSISIRTTVGHRQDTSSIMFDRIYYFILKLSSIDTLTNFASTSRITTLNYETLIEMLVPLILRWNMVLSYLPQAHNARKFLHDLGHS